MARLRNRPFTGAQVRRGSEGLGLTGVGQRKSYRDVKYYHRRKRWLS